MQKEKKAQRNAANFFYGFTSIFSCFCCCYLVSCRLRRSSITGKSNKLNYFNFFALLLLFLSTIRTQTQMLPLSLYRVLAIVPSAFLIRFCSFRKFTVREITLRVSERERRTNWELFSSRQIRSCAVISERCFVFAAAAAAASFCVIYYFLRKLCSGNKSSSIAHFPNKLTRIINGSREAGSC